MTTRYDVSEVAPQGGYLAKRCPVRAQLDVLEPCEALPVSPVVERRLARGRQFEAETLAALVALHPEAVVISGEDSRQDGERATLHAMSAGARLIVGGILPPDLAGRRVGAADLLVRAASGVGYRAVDVKCHRSLDAAGAGLPARCSGLGDPGFEAAVEDPSQSARRRRDDMLQLAHYQAMLDAAGCAGGDGRFGGIVGVEGVVTWYDLDARIWMTLSSSGRNKARSTMEAYQFEFDFRLDILAVAARHLGDPGVEPLVVPVRTSECGTCPWWSACGPTLAAGSGDVSLLPRMGWRGWRVHRDHGVSDRAALASLDHRSALLVAAKVDLRPLLAALGTLADETPVASVIGERKRAQIARLDEAGVR
ncbi:MAG: hypothetical protein ACYC1D_00520, partial [Acidimicrobiales bacterium]